MLTIRNFERQTAYFLDQWLPSHDISRAVSSAIEFPLCRRSQRAFFFTPSVKLDNFDFFVLVLLAKTTCCVLFILLTFGVGDGCCMAMPTYTTGTAALFRIKRSTLCSIVAEWDANKIDRDGIKWKTIAESALLRCLQWLESNCRDIFGEWMHRSYEPTTYLASRQGFVSILQWLYRRYGEYPFNIQLSESRYSDHMKVAANSIV